MKKFNWLKRNVGTICAFLALIVAQGATNHFSIIFYQDKAPIN